MIGIELLAIPLLLIFLILGVPVGYSMLISGTLGVVLVIGFQGAQGIIQSTPRNPISFTFTTIPLFILMAEFLSKAGLVEDMYEMTQRWLGHIPGGLAIATTVANGGMAALSGSSTATVAAMSKISYGEMRSYGYSDKLTLGTIASAGTFAIMIPPSLGLIVYGLLTGTNIGLLFLGGLLPGVITLLGYIAVIMVWSAMDSSVAGKVEEYSYAERIESTKKVWPGLLVIAIVIGGIYSGIITATEAGAVGAASAFLVSWIFYDLNSGDSSDALRSTLETSGMIFMIIFGALVFGYYLTVTRIPQQTITFISQLPVSSFSILLIVLVLYILLGTMMDQLAILVLTLPITYPLFVTGLGFDAIWFGILIAKTIEIGLVTPPIGLNVYIATGAVDADLVDGFKGSARFLLADFVVLVILLGFPEIVTWVH